jgi:hypothetical protein
MAIKSTSKAGISKLWREEDQRESRMVHGTIGRREERGGEWAN